MKMLNNTLIQKYNVPGPRYTSYPTVPYWDEKNFSTEKWIDTLQKSFKESNSKEGISLYLHLPFCESLCTFCACNKRITKQHNVELVYIETLLKEWQLYLNVLSEKPIIRELHLGGGTPSFFSPKNLIYLLENIFSKAEIHPNKEFSFEGHPNNTTREHLQALYNLGFKRVSFGVQDYDIRVQKAIHRIQPFENVKKVTEIARSLKSDSLYQSMLNKKIHRNFMGYTSSSTQVMIGLGVSSISDNWYAFAQNVKTIEEYYQKVNDHELPVFRGHILNAEDLFIRRHILNLMCLLETRWENEIIFTNYPEIIERLKEFEADGLIELNENSLIIKEEGRSFIRNICMAFDLRMMKNAPQTKLFSMTV